MIEKGDFHLKKIDAHITTKHFEVQKSKEFKNIVFK